VREGDRMGETDRQIKRQRERYTGARASTSCVREGDRMGETNRQIEMQRERYAS